MIEEVYDFKNLYNSHLKARRGKRQTREVIIFENNLAENLVELSEEIRNGTYKPSGYYSFKVTDPKERIIHALHYRDRVVQHCICDYVLSKLIEPRLIYDNAACRVGKGTDFSRNRLSDFMRKQYRSENGGYFLRYDIRKYFDNIDHVILKNKLRKIIKEDKFFELIELFIDSYSITEGKGIPLGNQTSQWFALFYMDGLDRLIKEKLGIKYYTRYMDDAVLIHGNKEYLKKCLTKMRNYACNELMIEFNEKTQIFPMRAGVDYLGFHFYITDKGKVIRRLRRSSVIRYKKRLKEMRWNYSKGDMELSELKQVLASYKGHLSNGNTYNLVQRSMKGFVLTREIF